MTEDGRVKMYLGEGRFTGDPIPANFFGVAGVAEIPGLQDVLLHVGVSGHRHHVSITPGLVQAPLQEALGNYLGFDVTRRKGLPPAGAPLAKPSDERAKALGCQAIGGTS